MTGRRDFPSLVNRRPVKWITDYGSAGVESHLGHVLDCRPVVLVDLGGLSAGVVTPLPVITLEPVRVVVGDSLAAALAVVR